MTRNTAPAKAVSKVSVLSNWLRNGTPIPSSPPARRPGGTVADKAVAAPEPNE
jgi:hypothetical protein